MVKVIEVSGEVTVKFSVPSARSSSKASITVIKVLLFAGRMRLSNEL